MAKEICISSTPHETRLAILEDDLLTEIYYERENEYTLAGSIYKGRVTRVLPGMQSAFVDLGLERDAFLYVTDFMEEQEDSADFEKVPNGNGSGNGSRSREGQAPREAQAGREPRESRPARTAVSPESDGRAVPGIEPRSASPNGAGEAAAGEDDQHGTRRWRGRRGRRRGGRPHGSREAGQASAQSRPSGDLTSGIEIEVETGPTIYEESVAHGGGQAAFSEAPASSHSSPARESAPATRAVSTPIVLPGESLSRYGAKPAESAPRTEARGASTPAAPAVSGIAYKPSTLVEVVPGWDGGAELPGETLSRHRGKSASARATAHAIEAPPAVEAHHGTSEPEAIVEDDAAETAGGGEVLGHAHGEEASPEAAVAEDISVPAHHLEEPTPHAVIADPTARIEEPVHEEAAFEPEHASASYRVDPAAPSEYRVSAVAEEEEHAIAPTEGAGFASETGPAHRDHPGAEDEASAPQGFVATVKELVETVKGFVGTASAPEEIRATDQEEAQHHASLETTSRDTISGETAAQAETATLHTGHATIDESPSTAEAEFFEDSEDEEANGPGGFAPGAGTIEEEIIEEEEYDFEPIHAHGDEHDLEDLEEETLDSLAGAEIGEMVRDTHLNQRIGTAPDGVSEEDDAEVEYGEIESEVDEEEDEEEAGEEAGEEQAAASSPAPARREGRPDDGRRGGRGPRRRGRPNSGGGGGSRRANSQLSDLPIISELLKQGQEILVQIAKEPIAKKGARITSHIALPGRFLVFMPTVNHVGVSRKISSDEERQRLKRILISEKGAASGGFIVRTAADGASEDDLRADIRFLISLWNDIKQRADEGKAPALIYHDLNLIERVLRDQVSANFATIWVDNEAEYERILRFLQRFEPSLVRRVKLYTKETPLFEQFGIQDEISKALKSKVWLKSGGSIVINQTEALVAIDINTGKYVGKTARLEDTILKTNLDAIPEIVRQIRLRDLGGIIVIDFIDMDERKNRHKVMAALEEELKSDRAPSKVLQFNDFGLVAITRKRVKQSLERTLSVQCEVCAGTGMVKSPTTVCNEIYTELRKMQRHLERGDVLLRVNPEVVKTLKANNARWLNEMEEMSGKTIIVKSDPALHPEQFDIQ
jgi:ribonuclease G